MNPTLFQSRIITSGSINPMPNLDLNELLDEHSVTKLIGVFPLLANALLRQRNLTFVLVFDTDHCFIERYHPNGKCRYLITPDVGKLITSSPQPGDLTWRQFFKWRKVSVMSKDAKSKMLNSYVLKTWNSSLHSSFTHLLYTISLSSHFDY